MLVYNNFILQEAEKTRSRENKKQQHNLASGEDTDDGDQTQDNDNDNDNDYDDDEDSDKDEGGVTPADVAGQAVLAFLAHDPDKREAFAQR